MYKFFFLLAFGSMTASATELCQTYLDGKTLDGFEVVSEQEVNVFPEPFFELQSLHHFTEEPENCLPLRKTDFKLPNGTVLSAYQTQNDSCDGGNTYGVVLDQTNKIQATIEDYDMYCHIRKLQMKVEKVVCGEIDPYEVGDACLVLGKVGGQHWGLVFDFDLFLDKFGDGKGGSGEETLKASPVPLNKKHLQRITKEGALRELRPFGPHHLFFQASLESLKLP